MTATSGLASVTLALDENKVTPGIVGFLVVFALGLATWLLIRSMSTQIRKVDFEEKDAEPRHPSRDGDGVPDDSPEPPPGS